MNCRSLAFVGLLSVPVAAGAEIFACANDSIRVFADEAAGVATPLRILEGANTGVGECYGLAIDADRRELWVAHGNVSVFPLAAQGNVAPVRSIAVGSAGLGFAASLAVDAVAGEVMVGTADGRIHTFARLATGGAPTRTIEGAGAGVAIVVGLAIDRLRDEVLVASLGSPSMLVAFARTASGAASPAEPPAMLGSAGQIALDAANDEAYVVSGPTIVVTRAGATLRTFSAGFLELPYGLALRADGEVLAGDRVASDPDPIKRFAAQPFGSVPPAATILNGSPPGRTIWGLASSRQAACASGNTVRCLFRDGLEQPPD